MTSTSQNINLLFRLTIISQKKSFFKHEIFIRLRELSGGGGSREEGDEGQDRERHVHTGGEEQLRVRGRRILLHGIQRAGVHQRRFRGGGRDVRC